MAAPIRIKTRARIKLDDKAWRELAATMTKLGGAHVKVGVLAGKGADTRANDTGLTVAQIAAIHEFGAPAANIPERSFLRSTFKIHEEALATITRRVARLILAQKMTPVEALNVLGAWGANKVKRQITGAGGIPPPLAAATAKQKGSTRTLVDTGQLVNSITHKVSFDSGDVASGASAGDGGVE